MGQKDSNLRMVESKSTDLPLVDAPFDKIKFYQKQNQNKRGCYDSSQIGAKVS